MRNPETHSSFNPTTASSDQPAIFRSVRRRARRGLELFALVALFITVSSATARGQNCDALAPSGDTSGNVDWFNINSCLTNVNRATLTAGDFYIAQPISMPAPFASLAGAGKSVTNVTPVFNCNNNIIEANGQNKAVNNVSVRNFRINLINCAPGAGGIVVSFLRTKQDTNPSTTGGEIIGLKINNHSDSMIGIQVSKSVGVTVRDNIVNNLGTGIWAANSPSTIIDSNNTNRNGLGIFVQNHSGVGTFFDSSNTRVTGNSVTESAHRAMKLQSSDGGGLPLRNLTVTGNTITGFGNIGLYLVGFVRDSRIENNYVVGASGSNYGLWVGSVNPGQGNAGLNPSFNNQINFNTFQAGSFDVSFNGAPTGNNIAGPDQPTITRLSRGNNTLGVRGIERTPTSNICGQYAHAWWNYLGGLNYVPSGGRVLLAAAGTRTGSRVTYHIRQPGSSSDLLTFTTFGTTNSVCVLNQENSPPINLAPGLYDVIVDLVDGNARFSFTDQFNPNTTPGVPIRDWKLSLQLDVR